MRINNPGIIKKGVSKPKMAWFKRLSGISLFLLFYFTALRPFRNQFSQWVVEWITEGNAAKHILEVQIIVRSFVVEYEVWNTLLTVAYIPQFGFFFLLGMLGVIWFLPGLKIYMALIVLQTMFEILILLSLWVGYHYSSAGFVIANLSMVYLSPMVCLGFILFLYLKKKGKI